MLSGEPSGRALGQLELRAFFERNAAPAGPETAALALHGLLSILLEDGEPWRFADDSHRPQVRIGHATEGPVAIVVDSMPELVVEFWRSRTEPITQAELQERDVRSALTVLWSGGVRAAGPFVAVEVAYQTRHAVPPGAPPEIYAGAVTVHLLQRADGWIVVSVGGWIT